MLRSKRLVIGYQPLIFSPSACLLLIICDAYQTSNLFISLTISQSHPKLWKWMNHHNTFISCCVLRVNQRRFFFVLTSELIHWPHPDLFFPEIKYLLLVPMQHHTCCQWGLQNQLSMRSVGETKLLNAVFYVVSSDINFNYSSYALACCLK